MCVLTVNNHHHFDFTNLSVKIRMIEMKNKISKSKKKNRDCNREDVTGNTEV